MDDPIIQREHADEFCRSHLAECCAEILDWKRTGLLVEGGRVRELACLCSFASYHALQVAEEFVKTEAMRRVAHGVNPCGEGKSNG